MGLVTFVTPGTQVTQSEYETNFTTIYDEFNGNIDNDNIKAAAGIVDTKLATITTAGKIATTALPATIAAQTTFTLGIIAAGNGVTVSSGGIAVTLGDVKIEDGRLIFSAETGITASTTQAQGQQPLTKSVNLVSTVANVNDVVTLPSLTTPFAHFVLIINSGANTLQIFPASGDKIDGLAVNASTTLAGGGTSSLEFWSVNSTNWITR